MILTKEDIAMFKSLEGSNTGKLLKDFLQRLSKDMCDVRNWKGDYSELNAKAMANASKAIEDEVIDRIKDKVVARKKLEPFK